MELVLFVIMMCLGGLVHGLSGFGFALVTMGFMSLYFSVKESTLIILALNAVFTFPAIFKYRHFIQIRALLSITCGAFLGTIAGVWFLNQFGDTPGMKTALGILLIIMVTWLILNHFFQWVRNATEAELISEQNKESHWARHMLAGIIGIAGGFVNAVFAVAGPIFVIYFLMRFAEKRAYHVNLQILFLIQISFTIGLQFIAGDMPSTFYFYLTLGIPFVLGGAFLGMALFEKIKKQWIERIAYLLILCSGCQLLLF